MKLYRNVFKRVFDLIISIILVPPFILLILLVGPLIYLEDKGSIFYNSNRLGKNGVLFKMYKFRSMRVNAPDIRNTDGSTFNSKDDVRLTRIGKFLRKTSLDEIPQLINVIKGDMAIIGPRPDLEEDLHIYSDYQKTKLAIRPGITGYCQAYYRNSITQDEKFNLDVYYYENISIHLDIRILLKTIKVVLLRRNVYKNI